MRLAIFDDYRLGVVAADGSSLVDATSALPWPHDPDPHGAGWWVRLCRDFASLRPAIEEAVSRGPSRAVEEVTLRAPVLNPSKVVAAAVNYAAHAAEMRVVQQRVGGGSIEGQHGQFDIFLKAPSSIVGPNEPVVLPAKPLAEKREIHHESELTIVIGRGGSHIPEERALEHVLGYTIGLDMTVRGQGDRSRRKSYDTFTPIGPWVVTADEVGDPHALRIQLWINGGVRQDVSSGDMTVKIPALIAHASSIMRLEPGDVLLTGAPPGVGEVHDGDDMQTEISRIGRMRNPVRAATG